MPTPNPLAHLTPNPRAASTRVQDILFKPADSEIAAGGAADRVMPGLALPIGTCRVGPRRSGLAEFEIAARSLVAIKPALRANAGFQKQEEDHCRNRDLFQRFIRLLPWFMPWQILEQK
jgi:hypothetical protein